MSRLGGLHTNQLTEVYAVVIFLHSVLVVLAVVVFVFVVVVVVVCDAARLDSRVDAVEGASNRAVRAGQ